MEKETLEETALAIIPDKSTPGWIDTHSAIERRGFIKGAEWQAERMYSEEEVLKILLKHQSDYRSTVRNTSPLNWSFDIKKWFEQFKKK